MKYDEGKSSKSNRKGWNSSEVLGLQQRLEVLQSHLSVDLQKLFIFPFAHLKVLMLGMLDVAMGTHL